MSWTNVTWTADAGVQPLVDAIVTALGDHAGWEFVETVVETHKSVLDSEADPVTYYNDTTHTFHVWRCLGTTNGIGVDFYVAFGRTLNHNASETTPGESGYMLFTTMKDWDTDTHRGIGHCGRASSGFQLGAGGVFGNGEQYYPILEPIVEEGDSTWGYWGNWNQTPVPDGPIQTQTPHLMSATNGCGMQFPNFPPDTAVGDLPDDAQQAYVRVTKNALFVVTKRYPGNSYYDNVAYCGVYQTGGLPDEMIPEVPIIQQHGSYSFSNGSTQSVLCLTDLPGATLESGRSSSDFFSTPYLSNWGYGSYASGSDREKMSFPSLSTLVAKPWGVAAKDGYLTHNYNGTVWPIVGIWILSVGGLPSGWAAGDTATSPDGAECIILPISGQDYFFLIDKEAY